MSWIEWLAATPAIEVLRTHPWVYPFVNGAHILAFAAGYGSILVVDLAYLGLFKEPAREEITSRVPGISAGAFAVAIAIGFLLFLTNPLEIWAHWAFRVKLVLITLALTNALVLHGARWRMSLRPVHQRGAALVSIALWTGVILCGRLIAF